jgi:ADP-heptose:LPS heptosyltransferase
LAPERPAIALDIHSEAQSRRMSLEKWARVAGALSSDIGGSFVLIGSPREAARSRAFLSRLPASVRVRDQCGRTSSGQLAGVLASCDVLLSSDSGPAHLANALGVPTVVLFGAGDDRITEPFNPAGRQVIRLPGLECAPCVANRCRLGTPRCLEDLDERVIVRAVAAALDSRG